MSRSYRKNPYLTDNQGGSTKEIKRIASKTIRKSKDVANGSSYKKHFESWNICDWKSFAPNSRKAKNK